MKVLALLLLATPLAGQTYVVAGDTTLTLTQLLQGHPEGMVLTLPSATGQSLGPAFTKLLSQEPALELQLGTQEVDRRQPLGRTLVALRGWDAEKPHWALLGADHQVLAEGTEAPSPAQFAERYHRSPLRTRAERLREFLKLNPGHAEALALLVLDLRSLGELRAEQALAAAHPQAPSGPPAAPLSPPPTAEGEAPALGQRGATEGPPPTKLPGADPTAPPAPGSREKAPLTEAEDARIWGEYGDRYRQFMATNLWPGPLPSESSPLALAAQLTAFAEHSPRLRELANHLMPEVEARLQARPTDDRRWKVWLSLREAGAGGRPTELMAGMAPPPGSRQWPPSAALEAFVEDAQARDDWHDAEPVLQAAYDRNQDLLETLDAAAREDANGRSAVHLGTYFGFGMWNGETALLAEAKLHLGKRQEADRIFREAFARAPRPEIAREAAALARRCGAEALAEAWEALGAEPR